MTYYRLFLQRKKHFILLGKNFLLFGDKSFCPIEGNSFCLLGDNLFCSLMTIHCLSLCIEFYSLGREIYSLKRVFYSRWIVFRRRRSESLIEIALSVCLSVRLQNEMDTNFKMRYSSYIMWPLLIVRPFVVLVFSSKSNFCSYERHV